MEEVDLLISQIRAAVNDDEDDALETAKTSLIELVRSPSVYDHVHMALKKELLEIRWELEEVLEAVTEAPEPVPEPEEEPEIKSEDLVLVYDDPRGLLLHRSPDETRWFATQMDPNSGKPVTFELPTEQILGLKQQLAGSPYWVKE